MKDMLDDAASSLTPLPDYLSHGLVAVATFGLLSFLCSTSLFSYLTFKIISWRRKLPTGQGQAERPVNQFLFLIYNLLFADIQQATAFLLNISSVKNNGIIIGTATCWAQGWFVSTGDLASSVFILVIACHTFLSVVKEYRLPQYAFFATVAGCWIFIYGMAVIGVAMHPHDLYVRAAAWCWINDDYQNARLWLHYFWIFASMFGTVLIYACIFLYLHHQSRSSPPGNKANYYHGARPLMVLYPLIYTICTIPLAAGRIAAFSGAEIGLGYYCIAGSMIACNGWLDVLLYASTRAEIVFSEFPPGEDTGLETFAFMGKGHSLGTTTIIEAGGLVSAGLRGNRGSGNGGRKGHGGSDSTDNLYKMGDISVAKNVSVRVSIARDGELGSRGYPQAAGGSKDGSEDHGSDSGWENSKSRRSESGRSGFSDMA
ncbi:hypothetical protein sscle_06g048740 [Sclerotinia sclerotiorum 1980 UF-70]|uniref:Uncharacterized protein n=1 Tax=Sclerotinia sclerotiorum (strain ATCC 18683 / 1980 / Ss-1) TaxID=665079 RepID=A0A1D9Q576_SCLS1|nr:hypothetical protein sscle_06g048740 [Sclerotinia sclerotiorum 1980 UF-70]